MLQNPVRVLREHAAVVRDRADADGDHANAVSKNEDSAAELESAASDLESDPVNRVNMAQPLRIIDLSPDAAAPEHPPEGPDLESGLAHFFRLPLTAEVAFLAS
jgi:hypothetical protein